MFTIQKDLNGIFWHIYNNARTRVNVSDFDVVIDDVSNTFIIQCKNGSNIPNQAISISLIQVIDLSVGTSPILFSGANGLIQLLTAKGYTPYLQVPPSVSVVVYRVGQVGVFTMTPTQFTDNFTETGLGTNTMLGWALRNGNNGTKNQQGKFSLNKGVSPYDVIGTLGGSANSVLIGHSHEVGSYEKEGEPNTITYTNIGLQAGSSNLYKYTKKKGQSNTGADAPSEDGLGKNMPPYLIDVWVERVTELVINSGSGGGGVQSVTGTTVDNTDPLNPVVNVPTNTSDLVNDGSDGINPFITADDVVVPNLEQVTDVGATTTNQITVQNVKIGSNAFSNTIIGNIATLPTGTGTTAIGFNAGSDASGYGGTFIGALAGSLNAFNKNICLSANQNASTASADNQFVINTNTKNIRFDTNVPLNILFQFPQVGGRFPISVNGITADANGNILISVGAVDSVNGQTGVVVLDAADVGAEPTKGADDNYVTDAQLVVIGNTSGTNTGDNATNTTSNAYADAKVADAIADGVTTVAPSQNAVFDALDFTRRLITKGTGSVTGTVSETILTTLTIPANTLDSSCFIWTTMDFFKNSSGAVTARLYINSANTLTGATLLGLVNLGSNRNVSFNRKFLVTGTSLDLLTANTVSTQVTNEFIDALFAASTVLTINPSADIFLIYTTQNDATGTVATNKMATVQKMKL